MFDMAQHVKSDLEVIRLALANRKNIKKVITEE